MAINLSKGQRVDISLQNLAVGLGWTGDSDLDASAFMVAGNGQMPAEEFFVFYNNLESKDKAVIHTGDLKDGGSGDVETIKVDIRKLDPRIEQILFTVTIHDAESSGENFGQVCYACQTFTRAYIHHLIVAKELLVGTLLSIHNLRALIRLMEHIRTLIAKGTFEAHVPELLGQWANNAKRAAA